MSMRKREYERRRHLAVVLTGLGFDEAEIGALRRVSNGLQRWFEWECNGEVERDDSTNATHRVIQTRHGAPRRVRTPDTESWHMRRLAAIMASKPALSYYVQTDPRGAALYILRPGDVPEGADVGGHYSRGICVY